MAHEIYYTSAPEGIKRGSSGFCTVGATENIPRALWERMEALSAYRHQFSASGGGGAGGSNPASWAHWLLNVAGASYHVLSHVCDSGVDHTQRTNAFAHHVVLEPSEMAAAGPAWMLEQPGVMNDRWDGRVGSIVRAMPLPRGSGWDDGPAICARWASLTGDAGWGGVLAEGAAKSPARGVCILFSPGQEILPLIGEAIRLLPAQSRWGVTFNTYFTSMPTSAACVWRCCLKGTPAADVALRYAAGGGGIVLDLTNPAGLGTPGESEYVMLARTGELSPAARLARATGAGATRSVKPAAMARPGAIPVKSPATINFPPPPPPVPSVPAISPFAEEFPEIETAGANASTVPPIVAPGPGYAAPMYAGNSPPPPPLAAASVPTVAAVRPLTLQREARRRVPSIREVDEALRATELAASTEKSTHRKHLLWLYFGALGAIAVGMLLVWLAFRASVPVEPTPPPPPHSTHQETAVPSVPSSNPSAEAAPPSVTPPGNQEAGPKVNPVVETPEPAPVTPVVPVVPVVLAAKPIELHDALERVTTGAGIRDKVQRIVIPSAEFSDLNAIRGLSVSFPGSRGAYTYKQDSLSGTLSATASDRAGGMAVELQWTGAGGASKATDILNISLDKSHPGLEIQWRTAVTMRKPELVTFAYWVLQNSALVADMGSGKTQRIEFPKVESKLMSLTDASSPLTLPADPPRDAVVTPKSQLPEGWTATWYTDWDVKDAALRTPENASQVLKFTRSTSTAAVDGWFLLTFRPGWSSVESTFTKRQAADTADLARYESDLRAVNTEIAEIKRDFNRTDPTLEGKQQDITALVGAYKTAVAGYKEWSDLDVALDLPDGLRIATLRFHRDDK